MKKSSRLIVVLGMHRSGTSVVTRGLQVMGVELGNKLMPPIDRNNEKGFWEDMDIYSINVEMLNSLNSDWHFLTPIQPADVNRLRRKGYIKKAIELLKEKTSGTQIFGFKDPRVVKLFPLWKEVFIQSQLNVNYVLTLRHPFSVCQSLARRDGLEIEKGVLLWLDHVISSLVGTAGENRIIVDYDRLVQSPDVELKRMANGLQLQIDLPELEKFKTEFLDQKLQHTIYQPTDLMTEREVHPLAKEVYLELLEAASGHRRLSTSSFRNKVIRWNNEFSRQKTALVLADKLTFNLAEHDRQIVSLNQIINERDAQITSLDAQITSLDAQITNLDTQNASLRVQLDSVTTTLSSITQSKGWRLLAPLRWLRLQQVRVQRLLKMVLLLLVQPRDALALLRGALNVWRHKGWAGVKSASQFYINYYIETSTNEGNTSSNSVYHYLRASKMDLFQDANSTGETYTPKVSVIVPNFNHSAYLEARLTSIYEQTYQNFEVILLDDCSTDDSVSILRKYAAEHSEKTRCYFNNINSGSPFSQWEKGILLAEGDLIWIAESDDFCEKNFLEKLVPFFSNDAILLSYARPVFVDEKGNRHIFAFEHYVGQIDQKKWSTSYIETAHNEVNTALALLNTIPNVSGVLFRKLDCHFSLFSDLEWKKMRVCGDWLFYLHLIRGGAIAYNCDTRNYYRIYEASTSKKTHGQDVYYQEHERVAIAVTSMYRIPSDLLSRLQARLKDYYFKNVVDGSAEKFDALFDLNKITQNMSARKPNVLMATYGLVAGGGEIYPIRLANALQKAGATVTLFNGSYEPTQPGVRKMLSPQIAIVTKTSALRINELLVNFGIDIIHSHHASMENYFAATRAIGTTNVKHITTLHGMYEMMSDFDFMYNTKNIRRSVDHWIYTADKNILPFEKNGLFTANKFTKMDNGLPIQSYNKVDLSPLGISSESFIACLASRAIPEKGWLEAIEATQKAREITQRDIHLLLIGNGPMYDLLKERNLPDFIHLLGFKGNIGDYLVSAQLGLVPSYFKGESFPFVMIEFFIAGIPVIASNIGEISRMIRTDDNRTGGSLIELQNGKVDSNDLADAMIKMVTDREFYDNCVNAVSLLRPRFDIDNIAQQYLAVYKRILG